MPPAIRRALPVELEGTSGLKLALYELANRIQYIGARSGGRTTTLDRFRAADFGSRENIHDASECVFLCIEKKHRTPRRTSQRSSDILPTVLSDPTPVRNDDIFDDDEVVWLLTEAQARLEGFGLHHRRLCNLGHRAQVKSLGKQEQVAQ